VSVRGEEDVRREKAFAREYLRVDPSEPEMNWVMIRTLLASVADTAVVPLQDVLGLGSEARMNTPATTSGNWRWRFGEGDLDAAHAERLGRIAEIYGRSGR
jgi:4-alpha-glucanotransferase